MTRQKEQARAAGKFKMDKALDYTGASNEFVGYGQLSSPAKVLGLYVDGTAVAELPAGQTRAAGIFSNLYSKENRQIVCLVPSGKFCRYFMLSNSTPGVITVFPASEI